MNINLPKFVTSILLLLCFTSIAQKKQCYVIFDMEAQITHVYKKVKFNSKKSQKVNDKFEYTFSCEYNNGQSYSTVCQKNGVLNQSEFEKIKRTKKFLSFENFGDCTISYNYIDYNGTDYFIVEKFGETYILYSDDTFTMKTEVQE